MQRTPFLQMKPSPAPDVSTTTAEKSYLGLKYRVMQKQGEVSLKWWDCFFCPWEELARAMTKNASNESGVLFTQFPLIYVVAPCSSLHFQQHTFAEKSMCGTLPEALGNRFSISASTTCVLETVFIHLSVHLTFAGTRENINPPVSHLNCGYSIHWDSIRVLHVLVAKY